MDTMAQKLWVKDMERMVSFYREHLGAEVLDQGDTFSCIRIEDTVVELYTGQPGSMHLTLQFNDFESMSESISLGKQFIARPVRSTISDSQTSYSCVLIDIEGNRVTLIYHQLFVTECMGVD